MSSEKIKASADRNIFISIKYFVVINLFIAAAVSMFFCFKCFFSLSGWGEIWDDFLFSFLISSAMSGGISGIIFYTDQYFPWLKSPLKRFAVDLISVTCYSFGMSFLLFLIFIIYVWKFGTFSVTTYVHAANSAVLPTVIALVITIFLTSRSFLLEWRQAAIIAEKMKSERFSRQYQSLKDQLNPHFLFNSLNVLGNLVYDNPEQANAFIEKLARIYRYVLDVQNEELVPMQDEIDFAFSYLELQEIRFGGKFQYTIVVDSTIDFSIPPLSLQLLLENAVKHNKATRESPLRIRILQENGKLIVKNNLQKRSDLSPSSGIGLTNIRERYQFFTDTPIEISTQDGNFTVVLPLISNSIST